MAEQIMWAVKGPSGVLQAIQFGATEHVAWRMFAYSCNVDYRPSWEVAMQAKGYRCIRVKVTEVQDA